MIRFFPAIRVLLCLKAALFQDGSGETRDRSSRPPLKDSRNGLAMPAAQAVELRTQRRQMAIKGLTGQASLQELFAPHAMDMSSQSVALA